MIYNLLFIQAASGNTELNRIERNLLQKKLVGICFFMKSYEFYF